MFVGVQPGCPFGALVRAFVELVRAVVIHVEEDPERFGAGVCVDGWDLGDSVFLLRDGELML